MCKTWLRTSTCRRQPIGVKELQSVVEFGGVQDKPAEYQLKVMNRNEIEDPDHSL